MNCAQSSPPGVRASVILTADMIGTESSIPTTPHSHPQKMRESSTTSGERLRRSPKTSGSMTFPTRNCSTPKLVRTSKTSEIESN